MHKTTITLSLLAAAALSACGSAEVRQDSAQYVTPVAGATVRPGTGKIMELLDPNGPVDGVSWQRMALHMDDGSMQILDRRGSQVAMGATVQVRTDGTLKPNPNSIRATP